MILPTTRPATARCRPDARFDGRFFTAVRTTGIYCRPSCPALTPQAAQRQLPSERRGRPAGRLPRLQAVPPRRLARIAGVGRPRRPRRPGAAADRRRRHRPGRRAGLARRLGYSERQVNRTLVAEVGAGRSRWPGPSEPRRRGYCWRPPICPPPTSPSPPVSPASGSSTTPSKRCSRPRRPGCARNGGRGAHGRARHDLAAAAVPGADGAGATLVSWARARWRDSSHTRTATFSRVLRAPYGPALVTLSAGDGAVACRLRLARPARPRGGRRAGAATARPRRRPGGGRRGAERRPGAGPAGDRVPACARRARWTASRWRSARSSGSRCRWPARAPCSAGWSPSTGAPAFEGEPWLLFPAAEDLADARSRSAADAPRPRAQPRRACAAAMPAAPTRPRPRRRPRRDPGPLLALPGIGPWTADYLRMRACRDPDVLLDDRPRRRAGRRRLGIDLTDGRPDWAPWRSYATHHLWAAITDADAATV